MRIEILPKKEKKEIYEILEDNYKINLPESHIIKQGKEKMRIFTGNLSEHELKILENTIRIETIGLYLAFIKDKELRISFDSCFLFKEASKNVIEINKEQTEKWFNGEDLEIKSNFKGYVLLKYNQNIIGCGKLSQGKILNFVPKERRIKFI